MEEDAVLAHAGISRAEVASLLAITSGSDVTELYVRLGSTSITVRRKASVRRSDQLTQPEPESVSGAESDPVLTVRATLVGVFRSSVVVGQVLEAGAPIGSVVALGMPTQVTVGEAGSVSEILVEDGSPVEYGQPLLVLLRETV